MVASIFMSLVGLVLLSCLSLKVTAKPQKYNMFDEIAVEMNTVGPYSNIDEKYPFYSLPFCRPPDLATNHKDLGNALAGDRLTASAYKLQFLVENEWSPLCTLKLNLEEMRALRKAVKKDYAFEMLIDELPVLGHIGFAEHKDAVYVSDQGAHRHGDTHLWLYTHTEFSFAWNGQHVIAVNLTHTPTYRTVLDFEDEDVLVEYSYSTRWTFVDTPVEDRLSIHQKEVAYEGQSLGVHWLGIINSMSLIIFLLAWAAFQLQRFIKRDFSRYLEVDDEDNLLEDGEESREDESGWKNVTSDVFRFPSRPLLFSCLIGAGYQLFVFTLSFLVLAATSQYIQEGDKGRIYIAGLVLYALTAGAGSNAAMKVYKSFFSSDRDFYRRGLGTFVSLLTSLLLAGPFLVAFSICNSVAWSHGSVSALPWTVVAGVLGFWLLAVTPLSALGAWVAKRAPHEKFDAPCTTTRQPREIPPQPWYASRLARFFLAGFLPICACYTEIYYILSSIWGHHIVSLFGILVLTSVLLLAVSVLVSILLTYLALGAEDYRWWWRTLAGGMYSGIFMLLGACAYYHFKSQMTGTLQAVFFFTYSALFSYFFALVLGSANYFVTVKFVRYIYSSIKID